MYGLYFLRKCPVGWSLGSALLAGLVQLAGVLASFYAVCVTLSMSAKTFCGNVEADSCNYAQYIEVRERALLRRVFFK